MEMGIARELFLGKGAFVLQTKGGERGVRKRVLGLRLGGGVIILARML